MLENYENIAGFNLEGYFIKHFGGPKLEEFIPTKETFDELADKEDFLGVCFIIDNIEKRVWVYQFDNIKGKKYVKAIKGEKKDKKLEELTINLFKNEAKYDLSNYSVHRALDNLELFTKLFKYQINEYPLYNQHYILPQYEGEEEEMAAQEEPQESAAIEVKTCANCGWVISATTTVCPKCRRPVSEKFKGKQE